MRCLPVIVRTLAVCLLSILPPLCRADSALSYRVSSFGFGIDYDRKLFDDLNIRLGYNGYVMQRKAESDGVQLSGSLRINAFSVLLDWHFNHSNWRVTSGLSQPGPEAQAQGHPLADSFTLNGQTYSAADLGQLDARIKTPHAIAPYLGLGWGRAVGPADRFQLLLDAGALYTGAPRARVTAQCGSSVITATCTKLVADVRAEATAQEYKWRHLKWWPVLGIGFAMRWQ